MYESTIGYLTIFPLMLFKFLFFTIKGINAIVHLFCIHGIILKHGLPEVQILNKSCTRNAKK